ncbi:SDR family NAD(P)-dependent oxidoreductase [Virgibacillus alimentarius]|uniref:Short-subunit dehydrogenase n=1 Tax=Virgibacillus alimentarius TaxID=698769 RepID=A0ABS4S5V7_9BACI|nr:MULTISPECIES: SDR family oxidoreductase [Virgibacillus]MBP2256441.1 short-subunit dehydrogenase [Virgibacillus alimentarius]HLR66386.1 SDR family oxidoreductase [Virgibacillus sp.]
MQNRLINKKVIVTGASSGIGKELVWHIARCGGIPIMLARSIEQLNNQRQMLKQSFGIIGYVYQVDLQNNEERERTIEQILKEHEQIHGLINNAGAGIFEFVKDTKQEDIDRMFQLNLFALIHLTKRFLLHFSYYQSGHIVNVASQAGKIATPKSAVYASTKHAVLGFTNALRLEVKKEGISVTAVNLGPVRTNFFTAADPDGIYQKNVGRLMLEPDDVAQKIIRHLFTNKREINLPSWMEIGSKLYHIFPRTAERLLKRQFNKK